MFGKIKSMLVAVLACASALFATFTRGLLSLSASPVALVALALFFTVMAQAADPVTVDAGLTDGANAVKTFFGTIFGIVVTIAISMIGLGYLKKLRKG